MARLTREQTREQTREKLLEAAAKVFARYGFGGAAIDVIAEAAGYSRGAFYSNFEGKEAIFLELMERHMSREREEAARVVEAAGSLEEILETLAERYATRREDQDWSLLAIEFALHAARSSDFAARVADLDAAHLVGTAQVVRRLAEITGRTVADPQRVAALFLAFRQGLALARAANPERISSSDVRDGLRGLVLSTFGPPP